MPVAFADLRRRTIDLQLKRGIALKNEETPSFFSRLERGDPACYEEAELFFDICLRRELAEDEFSFEPLGLASWQVHLPEQVGAFTGLTEEESKSLLRAVARILSTENALLPPPPHKPWQWPREFVRDHERLVTILASAKQGRPIVPFNLQPYRKLGRYIIAVSRVLVAANRLPNRAAAVQWVDALRIPL